MLQKVQSKVGASQDGCDVITCKAYSLWVRELVCRTKRRKSEAHNVKMVKIYDFLWKSLRPNIMGNAWTLCVVACCYVMGISPFKQGKKPPPPLHSHQFDNTQAQSTDRRNEWTEFSPKTFNQAWNILQNQRKKIYKLKKLAIDCEWARKRNQIVIDRKIKAEKRRKKSRAKHKNYSLTTASVVGWGEERRKKLQGISWSTSILSLLEALQQLLP